MNHSEQWVYLFYQTVVLKGTILLTRVSYPASCHSTYPAFIINIGKHIHCLFKFFCLFFLFNVLYLCYSSPKHTTCCFLLISNHILCIYILVQSLLVLIKWLKFLTVGRKEHISINTEYQHTPKVVLYWTQDDIFVEQIKI